MRSGFVYIIISKDKPDRCYIGSTIQKINTRWRSHNRKLKQGIHHADKLQNHVGRHGLSDLIFKIIEEGILEENLIDREQYWMDIIEPYFNSSKTATPGCQGSLRSEETRDKLGKAKMGSKNPNWSGKYDYPEGLTRNEKKIFRNKIRSLI